MGVLARPIEMVKIAEATDSVSYEYWYMDKNDKGALKFMKTCTKFEILKEAENDNLLMYRKVLWKLNGFKLDGEDYPDTTCWLS